MAADSPPDDEAHARVRPPAIPQAGLDFVYRLWVGEGSVLDLLERTADAGVPFDSMELRRRAARVAFQLLLPALSEWPVSRHRWTDVLPAASMRRRAVADTPRSGVDWAQTRRSGWPPRQFSLSYRERDRDDVLASTLRWTIEGIGALTDEVEKVARDAAEKVRLQLEVAAAFATTPTLRDLAPRRPSPTDLSALTAAGRPWSAVRTVARRLLELDRASDVAALAAIALAIEGEVAERLFHLSVLGLLVEGLIGAGWSIERAPSLLGWPHGEPLLVLVSPTGIRWDLWSEMSAAWNYYGVVEPYAVAVQGVRGQRRSLGSDIALLSESHALVVECKYSNDGQYVARDGWHQLVSYATEALELRPKASGVLVGPDEVVLERGTVWTNSGRIDVVGASAVVAAVLEQIR